MIIEALIRTRLAIASSVKAFGDVIVVKPVGSLWSDLEQKVHQLVKIDTAELKKKDANLTASVEVVESLITNGATVVSNPFPDLDMTDPSKPVLAQRSRVKIDFDKLPKAEADAIKDPTVKVSLLDETKTKSLIVLKDTKPK